MAIIRDNLSLKVVSVLAAVLLYVYVQAERNPTISRSLIVPVQVKHTPNGVTVELSEPQLDVTVTGPRLYIDRLKDGDAVAVVDVAAIHPDVGRPVSVQGRIETPTLPADWQAALTFDPPVRTLHVRVIPEDTRTISVAAQYPKDPPAGFRYGKPEITPPVVRVTGRADKTAKIAGMIVNADPPQPGANIDGLFTVSARDADNNPVDVTGITVTPASVRVQVPLVEAPSSKIVTVSPIWSELPAPPYRITAVTATPNQVKISGKPERLNQIFTIQTEDIPTRDLTETRDIEAFLIPIQGVQVQDLDGHTLTHITVRFVVQKLPSAAGGSSPSSPAGTQTHT
jgi:YbbR domain-containing protein